MNVRIEPELEKRIKEYCFEKNITVSDFVRKAVNYFLNSSNDKPKEKIDKGIFIATITNFFLFAEQFNLSSADLKKAKERAEKEYSEITKE